MFRWLAKIFLWFAKRYRARQRAIDLKILWPAFKKKAPDMDHAKAGFAWHAFQDTAWTDDFTEDEIVEYIDALG
jgi:hypothetical protein